MKKLLALIVILFFLSPGMIHSHGVTDDQMDMMVFMGHLTDAVNKTVEERKIKVDQQEGIDRFCVLLENAAKLLNDMNTRCKEISERERKK